MAAEKENVDILSVPWAHWIEGVLQELADIQPVSIAVLAMDKNGVIGSSYYGVDNSVRALFNQTILDDSVMNFIAVNADYIRDLISDDEEES